MLDAETVTCKLWGKYSTQIMGMFGLVKLFLTSEQLMNSVQHKTIKQTLYFENEDEFWMKELTIKSRNL